MAQTYALGIIGTGHIAAVIIKRLLATGYYAPDRIIVAPSRATSIPSMRACPADMRSMPINILMVVDLPAPFGPT